MASNITVDTITKGSTTLNTDEIVDTNSSQVCKAWVSFNGTSTVAIRDSFNVASITDNGTGEYTVNFSTSMPNANYTVGGMSASTTGSGVGFICLYTWAGSVPTTSSFRVRTNGNGSNINEDCAFANIQVFSN